MSLAGSLEDLGLGDILQIVSLSRKSGLLMIHSEEGEGRIVFCDGSVRAAFVKGEANDLRDLLVTTGFVADEEFERAGELAAARGERLDVIIPDCTGLTRERLDELRREHIERAVLRIFSWRGGEFSFEVRDEIEPRDSEILLSMGINAQYLSMEATRMNDEGDQSEIDEPDSECIEGEPLDEASDEGPFFSGEAVVASTSGSIDEPISEPMAGATAHRLELEPDAVGLDCEPMDVPVAEEECEEIPGLQPLGDGSDAEIFDLVAFAAARRVRQDEPTVSTDAKALECAGEAEPSRPRPACLIAIDPELAATEWQKANLSDLFQRVHIFQSREAGIARIRQYLARGDVPVALVSNDLSQDSAIGSNEVVEFVRRLKQQAPNMPVLVSWVEGEDEFSVPLADAMIRRPNTAFIGSRRSADVLEAAVVNLRTDICAWLDRARPSDAHSRVPVHPEPAPRTVAEEPASGLQRLREASRRMRDPEMRGEVLSLVLEFAAQSFSRVAIFMVRDETAVGIAQLGLPSAGGPGDDEFCGFEIPAADVEWFARVIEGRSAIAEAPVGDGDQALSLWLGGRSPAEAYIAPIESGGRVVALLYADNLPAGGSVPDTTILEIMLHEAGLALERALLQRALDRVEHDTSS
ncbi:MAG: DUF4388 domain-containing protein [Myxococcota bacterium]